MSKRIRNTIAALGAAAVIAGGAGAALGASPADECAAAGGTYAKSGGTASCSFPVGQSDNTKVVDQKGSFNSSHDEDYTNPGGNQPGGQQDQNRVGK